MAETIYIDTCALNRLTDDHSQVRDREEAVAMVLILDLVAAGSLRWLTSSVLEFEVSRSPDPIRRIDIYKLLSNATAIVAPTHDAFQRARGLASIGLSYVDALHFAVAEESDVDWLITTDDRF